MVMSVKALVDSATMNMPFSPDVPAASQVQFLRLVMNAKLDTRWVDVIDWMTERSHMQHAIAFKVFGETSEKLRLYADMLDLRRVLIRDEYEDMALMLTKLGSATPQKVVELADTLGLGKLSNMHSYVAAISDKVHEIPNNKVALLLEEPASFVVRLKTESQGVSERAKAFVKHKIPAKSVNCFDGGTYEGFVRSFSGEAGALLAMLDSEGAAAPQKRHLGPRQLVLDGRRLHEIRARRSGHFSMPATVLHRSESYLSVPWHLSMPRVGPWKGPTARSEGIQQKLGGSGATRARPMALKGATGRDR